MKSLWLIPIVLILAVGTLHAQEAYYVVQPGDTLGSIADKVGNGMTWQKLWELNSTTIKDPHMIYPEQKLKLGLSKAKKPVVTKEEKINRLVSIMSRIACIPVESKHTLRQRLLYNHKVLTLSRAERLASQRTIMLESTLATRQYEIWLLAEAIVSQVNDNDELYRITGLAWQETHFVNTRGKSHDERGFFQFLPSTVAWWFKAEGYALDTLLWELENDPAFAVKTALDMLRKNNWDWKWWNHGLGFQYQVNNKIYSVKREMQL